MIWNLKSKVENIPWRLWRLNRGQLHCRVFLRTRRKSRSKVQIGANSAFRQRCCVHLDHGFGTIIVTTTRCLHKVCTSTPTVKAECRKHCSGKNMVLLISSWGTDTHAHTWYSAHAASLTLSQMHWHICKITCETMLQHLPRTGHGEFRWMLAAKISSCQILRKTCSGALPVICLVCVEDVVQVFLHVLYHTTSLAHAKHCNADDTLVPTRVVAQQEELLDTRAPSACTP